MTLYVTSQGADRLRRVLAEDVLRVEAEQLRVVTRDVGGSFGMKAALYTEYVLVLWATKRVGRPVKWVAGRSESFVSDTHGRDIRLAGRTRARCRRPHAGAARRVDREPRRAILDRVDR